MIKIEKEELIKTIKNEPVIFVKIKIYGMELFFSKYIYFSEDLTTNTFTS